MSHKPKDPTDTLKQAVGRSAKSNKHITKITAKPAHEAEKPSQEPSGALHDAANASANSDRPATAVSEKTAENALQKASESKTMNRKTAKLAKKQAKKDRKSAAEKPLKEVFLLARPFVALGRYIRDSWREIRRVRWPNRKATWKMTGAVLAYCVAFMAFVVLLDSFFTWIFSLIIK